MSYIKTFESFVNEAESERLLFKVKFNPVYTDNDNKPASPVFCKLTDAEHKKIRMYAAVEGIGGFASYKTFDNVPAKDRIGATETTYEELLPYVKSLLKTKLHR
jgi:hypothetical protein